MQDTANNIYEGHMTTTSCMVLWSRWAKNLIVYTLVVRWEI